MSVEFVNEQEGKQALLNVRSDANDNDWCLFSYENAKSQKIVLVGQGNGGIAELASNLNDDMVGYGLVRKTDKIDESITVKFGFIMWLGENVGRMQKARISVHKGKMQEFIGQYHVDITASHKEEITDQILTEKIMDTSGSGSRVLNKSTGTKELSSQSSTGTSSRATGTKSNNKGTLEFGDSAQLKDAIAEVRNNKNETTWVLLTYDGEDSNTVVLLGKGSGDVDNDLIPQLKDNLVAYGLIRKIEKIDDSETVKFVFLRFVGENIHRMLRARLGTHFGAITAFLNPYHVSLDVTQTDEISDQIIIQKIRNASGTSVHVVAEQQNKPTTSTWNRPTSTTTTKAPVVPKSLGNDTQAVKFKDEQAIKDDIRDVRSDATETNWCLVGYEGGKGNVLVSLAKGSGGLDELLGHFQDNMVGYALIRKTEKIDESLTVKFGFINWVGDNIDRMHRARIGTHKGAVNSLFAPFHVDFNCSQKSEISEEIITNKIGEASGTASKLR